MITYSGNTPRIRGRSAKDFVNPYKGVGIYSNWSLYAGNGPLSDQPTINHVPGTGIYPHGIQLSRRFEGLDTQAPLDNSGKGPVLTWYVRYSTVLLEMGKDGQSLFEVGYGHIPRTTSYSEWNPYLYRGVAPNPFGTTLGHRERSIGDPGAASSFGASHPYDFDIKSISKPPLKDSGEPINEKPAGIEYAFKRVEEWQGVPSSKVL